MMNRTLGVGLTLAVAVGASLLAAPAVEATPNAVPAYGDLRLKGPFGERLDRLVKNHVLVCGGTCVWRDRPTREDCSTNRDVDLS